MALAADYRGALGRLQRAAVAVAALVRLPNVFTAPPDVLAGAAVAVAVGAAVDPVTVAALCVASAFVYAGGTALNDVADAEADARERPERPIPSGAISRADALLVAAVALVAGVALATTLGGVLPGATALLLSLVVVLYDVALKGGPGGYLAMGGARGLNVLLGLSVAGASALEPWAAVVPVVLAVYVASLTRMAEGETGGATRSTVAGAGAGALVAGLAAVAAVDALAGGTELIVGTLLAACFLAWVTRSLTRAYADPVPERIGPAVGAGVLGIVLLDAAVAAVAGPPSALVAGSFLLPSVGLSRRFEVS
jgi:4-hydroxybenzoate polyprenyltransferase